MTAVQTHLDTANTIVFKLGTAVLTGGTDQIDRAYLHELAGEFAELVRAGRRVVVVSSGAIGAGLGVLGLRQRPTDLGVLQAAAAAGQPPLVAAWEEAMSAQGVRTAQVLVSRSDFDSRERFLNVRNCLSALFTHGVVPVVNENDAVATEEIALGDNDVLAAKLAHAAHADALVLLTSAQGVTSASGEVIREAVSAESLRTHVRSERTSQGRGGMGTKLDAALAACSAGIATVIGPGRPAAGVGAIVRGAALGTFIHPAERVASRGAWIALAATPAGVITVDAGAVLALRERGASLLPKGITAVAGRFERGDVVSVIGPGDEPIATGLSNLASYELDLVMGLPSSELALRLGKRVHDEAVHRDNLVILR